jgi:hypothetical protein
MRHRPVMGEPLFLLCVKVGESEAAATALRAELEAVRIELATVHAGANVRAAPPRRTVTMRSATGRPCKPSLAGTTAHRTQAKRTSLSGWITKLLCALRASFAWFSRGAWRVMLLPIATHGCPNGSPQPRTAPT